MKKSFVLSLAAAVLLSTNAFAADSPAVKGPEGKKIAKKIGDLLDNNNIVLEENQEISASVKFMVNENGEIVVLSVRTGDEVVESFVKARLNYQEISVEGLERGKTYEVPVRFTS